MSKIALSGDASGTGTFTIASPNSNSNFTLTLPAESGTVLTTGSTTGISASALSTGTIPKARMFAGAVLQVVTFKYTTGQTFSSVTSLNYQDTGLTLSITPSSASNKVLVLVTASHSGPTSGNIGSTLAVKRDSTRIAEGVGNNAPATNGETMAPASGIIVLDSPASTSSVAYTVQIAPRGSTATVYFNRNYATTGFESFITLMEIAG